MGWLGRGRVGNGFAAVTARDATSNFTTSSWPVLRYATPDFASGRDRPAAREAVMARSKATAEVVRIGGDVPTNGSDEAIAFLEPFTAEVRIEGSADILFHRWNPEAVDEKAKAAKGSAAKKSDNIESYVYRNDAGEICLPGEYLRGAIVGAAKFRQDPRSPRKSAMDLFKAGVVSLTPLAPMYSAASRGTASGGKASHGEAGCGAATGWDYEDRRRVVVQRSGINRTRPAMKVGWSATFLLMVTLPEYISPQVLNEVIATAGRIGGLGDFRPTYGRFSVVSYRVIED